jgi:hypothetical protein
MSMRHTPGTAKSFSTETGRPCCGEQYPQRARERFRYDQKGSVSRQAECEYFSETFVIIEFVDRIVEYPHLEITR